MDGITIRNNELTKIKEVYNVINIYEKESIKPLVHVMSNKAYYGKMLDVIDYEDEEDYSQFNDLEMIYLFVHQEKDQDEAKNRIADTKREYLRELLWIYHLFNANGALFDFDSDKLDVFTLLRSIKRRNIRKFQSWLKEAPLGKGNKPYSVATISRKTGLFKSFLRFLYNKGYIKQPIHEAFKSVNIHKRDRPNRDINSGEVLPILNYYKDHPIIYSLLSVFVTTGLRVRELCMARICDLTYEQQAYWLEVTGKGNEKREVLIHPNVFDTIVACRKRRGLDTVLSKGDTSPIFVTSRHNPYSYKYLSNYLTQAIQKTGFDFIKHRESIISPHTLRHGFAIISVEEGADVFRIMQTLGHKKMETTMVYLERHLARKNNAAHSWKNSAIINSI